MNDTVINIDSKKLQKLCFLYNSLENGWTIKKKQDKYIFSKKHLGKKEILSDNYLSTFIEQNSQNKIILD